MTFENIMNFYPEHNSSVYEELQDLISNNSLIPFVGAGLSAFCGYPSWSNALFKLSNQIIDENERKRIREKIQNNDLLSAAQDIYDSLTPVNMLSDMQHLFNIDLINNCSQTKMELSAAYVLPILFKDSPVMTTNFDTVLENAYDNANKSFERVISPYEPDLLTQLRQRNARALFKLHGSINKKIISFNDLVFTESQYSKAYSDDGTLKKELKHWFEDKQLIFLGCSLSIDETMKLLQSIVQEKPTVKHYAIVSCKKEDLSKRIKEIGKMGIRTIFYPDGEYDSVRIILERLLEECNPSEYQQLPCYITDEKVTESTDGKPFLYDSNFISFFGREAETEELENFCQTDKRICWWAVTGPGGIGKSRLVYEFIKKKEKEGWSTIWIKPYQYNTLDHFEPSINKSIVVADDVQAKLKQVGEWMQRIYGKRRSEKLRLILLERDGNDLNNATWGETLQNGEEDSVHQQLCYKDEFLNLTALTKQDLKNIIVEYIEKLGKLLTDDDAENLLNSLETVDPELSRPLYAIAIADAFCSDKDPTHWDKKELLKYVADREINFHIYRLRDLLDGKKKMTENELKQLLITSCIYGAILLDEIIERAPKEWPKLVEKAEDLDLSIEDFLKQIGVVHELTFHNSKSDNTKSVEAVILQCPDLVKEYIVLHNTIDKNKFESLFSSNWINDPLCLLFCIRLLRDYPEKLKNQPTFWENCFTNTPDNKFCQSLYAHFLFGVTIERPELSKKVVNKMEKLSAKITDDYFNELYANILFNSSINLPEEKKSMAEKLDSLQKQFDTNENIASAYARSLLHLCFEQDGNERQETTEKLAKLHNNFSNNESIGLAYADSLFCLSEKQELEECKKTIKQLKTLHNLFFTNENIAISYAFGLLVLSLESKLEYCQEIAKELGNLQNSFSSNEEITLAYAKGLFHSCFNQEEKKHLKITKEIEQLHNTFSSNKDIALVYADSLFSLSVKQELKDCQETTKKLENLHNSFNTNKDIALSYAKSLYNLSIEQELKDIQKTGKKMEILCKSFKTNEKITLIYANLLEFLSTKLELNICKKAVQELHRLHELFNDNENIAKAYSSSLVNFSFIQHIESEIEETLNVSYSLLTLFVDNEDFQLNYAKTWFNLTLKQTGENLSKTIIKIRDFLLEHQSINSDFQKALDVYLEKHPEHIKRYELLRIKV